MLCVAEGLACVAIRTLGLLDVPAHPVSSIRTTVAAIRRLM